MATSRTQVPLVGLSVMPEPAFAAATSSLFGDGLVDVVEWSFDMGWGPTGVPPWLDSLLDDFASADRLDGHGVSFSLLSDHPRQEAWLDRLEVELRQRPYRRVSEHLGFMAAGPFHRSSPLPMPHHPEVVAHGRTQVARLSERAGAPVGIENLATSLTLADATGQGDLCADLLGPTEGWMVLDLHNLWCQAVNFGLDPGDLLAAQPCHVVRELHLSGGSWWCPPGRARSVRRDTHDGPVPDEVLALLPAALDACPGVDTVILERIGTAFGRPEDDERFGRDLVAIRSLCGVGS